MERINNDIETIELEYNLICDFIKLRNELGLTQKQMADEAHVVREINTLIKILKPFGYTLSITKIDK